MIFICRTLKKHVTWPARVLLSRSTACSLPILKGKIFNLLIALVIALQFTSAVLARTTDSKTSPPTVREKWAAIVAIGQFQDPLIQPLKSSVDNATQLLKTFKNPLAGRFAADHVLTLVDKSATKSGIEAAMLSSWLVKKALPNDLVVLYFSSRIEISADGRIYLLTYDSLSSEPERSAVDLLAMLTDIKHRTQCRHVLCILDSCSLSGQDALEGSRVKLSDAGVSIWSANQPGAQSYQSRVSATSCFTHFLIDGLTSGAGLLPLSTVADYVAKSVSAEISAQPGKKQTPLLSIAADSPDMLKCRIGVVVKSSIPPKTISIGHPVDQLPITRPDLIHRRAPQETPEDDDDEHCGQSTQLDFGHYIASMKQSIRSRWHPPAGFENCRVVAVFTILRDGTIVDEQIIHSSGLPAVDKSALDALRAASPLEALPLGAPKSVQIRYQFDWHVQRRS